MYSSVNYLLWYHQPFKAFYITARIILLLPLLPYWIVHYSLPSWRPRASWSLRECVLVRVIRWLMALNSRCGLSLLVADKQFVGGEKPALPPGLKELKETSVIWVEAVRKELVKGAAKDEVVRSAKVPGYVWPMGGVLEGTKEEVGKRGEERVFGLFFHGGGYMMGNGGEGFGEVDIARQLSKTSGIKDILSVDYRLASEGSHPAQLLDALSGYAYLVDTLGIDPSRIVIIGACAGGHLALMLARYLQDEKVLPLPRAIMLFSPWVDMDIDQRMEHDPRIKRPNTDIDLLATSYLANLRFLGHNSPGLLSTPLLSGNLAPPGSYTGYPKTFVSVGGCEQFYRECEQLVGLMRADGVDVTMDVQPDAVHDFWGFGSGVPSNDARMRLAENAITWIDRLDTER